MNVDMQNWFDNLYVPGKPDEYEVKQFLKLAGLYVPKGRVFSIGEDVDLLGLDQPFVAKVCSPDILHKTEMGGVILNLGKKEVPNAVEQLFKKFPKARVLVEQQQKYLATEFIIGSLVDPVFGQCIMAGTGGIFTEIFKDATFRLAPCSVNEAKGMLDELLLSPLFKGFRGMQVDKTELAKIIAIISEILTANKNFLINMDINPIVFSMGKWIVLDAKITFE